MDSCTEYLGTRSPLYLAPGCVTGSRDVGLVKSGPFRTSTGGRNWPKTAATPLSMRITLSAANLSVRCSRGLREISELGSGSEESTVVDAMWGAGNEESAERLGMACELRIITSTRTINP